MTAPMKLSARLPEGPVVAALALAMTERPLAPRLLVLEVDAPNAHLTYGPDGEEVRTPIASISSLAWITDPVDLAIVRVAARRAYDAHTGQPPLTESVPLDDLGTDGDMGTNAPDIDPADELSESLVGILAPTLQPTEATK